MGRQALLMVAFDLADPEHPKTHAPEWLLRAARTRGCCVLAGWSVDCLFVRGIRRAGRNRRAARSGIGRQVAGVHRRWNTTEMVRPAS